MSPFIGRRGELEELGRTVAVERAVTVVGAGGSGKTRLVSEVLARSAAADPLAWVELGPVRDPAMVVEQVARAAGVTIDAVKGPLLSVCAQLRERPMLLCWDNCEHLLEACASLADVLLRECPRLRLLATSRQPLGIDGEMTWRLSPMRQAEAIDLFVDRARRARADLVMDDEAVAAVSRICVRLEGMPLALEMAAGWAKVLTPMQIDAALDDRFRLLVSPKRGTVTRHATLEASVDWSYQLLSENSQRLLRQVSAFVNWFCLDDAHALDEESSLVEVTESLRALGDLSLLRVVDVAGVARYRLSETVRDFAIQRRREAGEEDAVCRRHMAYFGDCAVRLSKSAAENSSAAFDDLDRIYDDVSVAVRFALATDDTAAAREILVALIPYWATRRSACDGVALLEEFLPRIDDATQLGRLQGALAIIAAVAGRRDLVEHASAQAFELASSTGDEMSSAVAFAAAAQSAYDSDPYRAAALARTAHERANKAGCWFTSEFALTIEALALANHDRFTDAEARAQALYRRVAAHHDPFRVALARGVFARCATQTGDLRRAEFHGRIAAGMSARLGHYHVGGLTAIYAWAQALGGDVDAALELIRQPVAPSGDAEIDAGGTALVTGKILLLSGDLHAAMDLLARAIGPSQSPSSNWIVGRARPAFAKALRLAGRRDDAQVCAELALAEADALGVPSLRAEALDELGSLRMDIDPVRAAKLHHEALVLRTELGLHTFVPDSLDALAADECATGRLDAAARLLAASDAARSVVGYPRPRVSGPWHSTITEELESALGSDTYALRRGEGLAMQAGEAVDYACRARGSRNRPTFGWASLTPTEQQIIGLLPLGMTNTAIGERLFMSRSTVKAHLSHIYTKLDVSNRQELVAVAATRTHDTLSKRGG